MSPHAHFNRSRSRIPTLAAAILLTLAVSAQARPGDPGAATPTRVPAAPPTRAAQDVSTDIHATLARADANGRAQDPQPINAVPVATSGTLSGPPTWPAHPQPIKAVPAADDSSSINWTTIGLGLAGSLLAVSGILALIGRRSRRLHRLSLTP
jgi:hypothetical protein